MGLYRQRWGFGGLDASYHVPSPPFMHICNIKVIFIPTPPAPHFICGNLFFFFFLDCYCVYIKIVIDRVLDLVVVVRPMMILNYIKNVFVNCPICHFTEVIARYTCSG